jgi:hypothetical protein
MSFRGPDPKFDSLTASEDNSAGNVDLLVENTSNTASSTARIRAKVAGSSADDAFHTAEINGGEVYSWGIDNSDSDKFKLSDNATLGTNDVFEVSSQVLTTTKASFATSGMSNIGDADYTVTDTDGFDVLYTGTTLTANRTITLPTAADNTGRVLTIKKADTGNFRVIIDGEGSETIDGDTTKNLNVQYESIKIACDGTGWQVLERKSTTEWTSYTPTMSDEGSTTPTFNTARWRKVGQNIEIMLQISFSGAGSGTTNAINVSLPNSYTIDTSLINTTTKSTSYNQAKDGNAGYGSYADLQSGSNDGVFNSLMCAAYTDDTIGFAARGGNHVNNAPGITGSLIGNTDEIAAFINVPIENWEA